MSSPQASPPYGRRVPGGRPSSAAPSKHLLLSCSMSTPQQGWQRKSAAGLWNWGLGVTRKKSWGPRWQETALGEVFRLWELAGHRHHPMLRSRALTLYNPRVSSDNDCLSQRSKVRPERTSSSSWTQPISEVSFGTASVFFAATSGRQSWTKEGVKGQGLTHLGGDSRARFASHFLSSPQFFSKGI